MELDLATTTTGQWNGYGAQGRCSLQPGRGYSERSLSEMHLLESLGMGVGTPFANLFILL
jgi:hypothetical protein